MTTIRLLLSILCPGDLLARGCRQRGHQLRVDVRQYHGQAPVRGGEKTEELQRIQKGNLIKNMNKLMYATTRILVNSARISAHRRQCPRQGVSGERAQRARHERLQGSASAMSILISKLS